MKLLKALAKCTPLFILTACGETKTICKGNRIYQYVNNQGIHGRRDQVIEYTVTNSFKSKIRDKTDYYLVSTVSSGDLIPTDSAEIDPSKVANFSGLENAYYTSETKTFVSNKQFEQNGFKYFFGKFALTGMTIPMKFRGGVGNDTINPPTLETGFNVNFAPSYRLNWSNFDPSKKFLGNSLTNYSITFGGLLGIGGADLNVKTNAPGLLSNRKSTTLTYGGMVLFGLNSIGVGYAFGFDNVLGQGCKHWVYQNKLWHGVTISVDLIK